MVARKAGPLDRCAVQDYNTVGTREWLEYRRIENALQACMVHGWKDACMFTSPICACALQSGGCTQIVSMLMAGKPSTACGTQIELVWATAKACLKLFRCWVGTVSPAEAEHYALACVLRPIARATQGGPLRLLEFEFDGVSGRRFS